ncbi:hypothetical protein KJ762_12205 [bacterium]|nr:hypothetical protein [bacterium]MBU1063403.1 hypothetical protein [bacterium]MBU1635256.1 hypothetical protein [bacterium]MBU1872199.1 hypothetical protein [bacterium]
MTDYQLPFDGSVLIIDDKIEEALPLIKLLSKNGIASTFYTGTRDSELPIAPAQKIRLAFIDIQLFPASNSYTYAQNILRLLERIIPDNNGPYILLVWSKLEDVHAAELENQVISPAFAKRPVIFLRLSKASYFDTVSDESLQEQLEEAYSDLKTRFANDDLTAIKDVINSKMPARTILKAKPDALKSISDKMRVELEKADAFHLFTIWENLINKAAGKTVGSFSNLYRTDKYWTKNLKSGIYRMAHAQLGKVIDSVDDNDLIRNAIITLNRSFLDVLENDINETIDLSSIIRINRTAVSFTKSMNNTEYTIMWKVRLGKFKLLINGRKVLEKTNIERIAGYGNTVDEQDITRKLVEEYVSISPEINTRLLIEFPTSKSIQPGNVYKIEDIHWNRKRSLLANYYIANNDILGKNDTGQYKVSNGELKKIIFVELEVTPLCDYAQNKWLKSRLLPGLLVPERYAKTLEKNKSESLYKIIPLIKINGQCYKLVFNFHLLKSVDIEKDDRKLIQPLFRVKKEVCADIRSRLSSHANRIGITAIE